MNTIYFNIILTVIYFKKIDSKLLRSYILLNLILIKTYMTIKRILLISSIFFLSCSREYIKPLNVKRNFSGSLWIVRHEIATPQKIDRLISSVKNTDIRNLFVQVRGRGDAYYDSAYEPKPVDVPPDFDPLDYIIKKGKKSGIKIHAWINVSFVLNPENYPAISDHILSKHPDWVTYDYKGRPMTDYTSRELRKNILEGYFLDPAVPGVRIYTAGIVRDIVSKYKIDGIHLDFIRYPYSGYNRYYKKYLSDFGYNPYARREFKKKYGVDPVKINRFGNSRYKKLFDSYRRDKITDIVRLINKTVKEKDNSVLVSAAVMPRYDLGRDVYFQDWPYWLDNGLIDIACVMSYTGKKSIYKNYLSYSLKTDMPEKIYMGVMVKGKTTVKQAHEQIRLSYEDGFRGYIIFSFKHKKRYLQKIDQYIQYDENIMTN